MGKLTMNKKEREQVKVFEQLSQKQITQREAAARLRMTARWIREKHRRYRQDGDAGLVHGNRGKPSKSKWSQEERGLLISLLQNEWHGFGPTFAAEKLYEAYGIKITRETARKTMIDSSLWKAKATKYKHRKRRERVPMFGMMIQLDGSPHDWFEGRGNPCTLLVFIDDATSRILWLEFAHGESVQALMQATKNYVEQCGIPQLFYTDHGSVFHVNLNNPEEEKKTQWERACHRLGIEVKHAHSPQAKGRVERCNQTLQDRLIKEMRLCGINSIESANHYLRTSDFIAKHNSKFAIKAMQSGDAHASSESYNLGDVFTTRETRVLANDFTIQYNKQIFQLLPDQKTILRPKNQIIVKTYLNEDIKLWIRKTELFFDIIHTREKKVPKAHVAKPCVYHKPSINSRRWACGLAPTESRVKPVSPTVEAK
jgi:hypothetical protein